MRLAALLLVAAVLAGGCATTRGATAGAARPNQPAPDFTLPTLAGGPLALSSLRGQVVVVDFWASWCAPCREELPALEQLRASYEPRGVAFVALNVDDDREAAAGAAKSLGLAMPVLLDPEKKVAAAWQPPTMPTSYVVDREGVVRFVHEGFNGTPDVDKLKRELEQLLAAAATK